jgi:hypothetical protein
MVYEDGELLPPEAMSLLTTAQIAAFFQKINQETERPLALESVVENGHTKDDKPKTTFDPIGRRLHIHQ